MSPRVKKAAFTVWYLALIFVAVDALLEFGYQRTQSMPGPLGPLTELFSVVLILGTGIPMLLYLWKRNPSRVGGAILVAIFLASTVLLVGFLAPDVQVSAEMRAKMQWYTNDLRSQGFTVVDAGQYSYHHGGAPQRLFTYTEVVSTAKSINCTTIYLHPGTPTNFIFFMGDEIQIIFWTQQAGEYMFYDAPYQSQTSGVH
jgi:hypothetical protein